MVDGVEEEAGWRWKVSAGHPLSLKNLFAGRSISELVSNFTTRIDILFVIVSNRGSFAISTTG